MLTARGTRMYICDRNDSSNQTRKLRLIRASQLWRSIVLQCAKVAALALADTMLQALTY